MKKALKGFMFVLMFALAVGLAACGEPTKITLSETEVSLMVGATKTVEATASDGATVTWSSSNEAIATVANGTITGVAIGDVTITASAGRAKAKVAVTVTEARTITLSKTSVTLEVGATETITVAYPSGAPVTWSSSDETIATVDSGTIKAIAVGSATITAQAGDITASVSVTVKEKPASLPRSIVILGTSEDDTYVAGTTQQLTASVKPDDADQSLIWASDDEAIATVDETGLVTFVGLGDGSISVTSAARATVSYTYEFTVKAPLPESIEISGDASVLINTTITLTAKVLPEFTNQAVTWNSADSTVVTVDANGVVTGISAGTTTITATSRANTDIKATYDVTVTLPDPEHFIISGLDEVYMVGETSNISVVIEPALASQAVTYTSSNESVITISASGFLTAVAIGTSTVTVQSVKEDVKYTIDIKVISEITPDTTKAVVCDLGSVKRYDEVTVDGATYYAGITAFDSLGEALNAAVKDQIIYVTAGTWSGEGTISVSGVKVYGANKDIDPSKLTRVNPSIITGTITLDDGHDGIDDLTGIEFNGLDFTVDGRIISKKDDFSNFVFAYNSVHDWTEKASAWTAENISSYTGFLTLVCTSNSTRASNITVKNNLFEGVSDYNVYLARVNVVTLTDNVFHNFGRDAFRVDGGYVGGLHLITGNTFKNDTQQGTNGVYYKSMSANTGEDLNIVKIEDNYFENIGTPGSTLAYNGAFSAHRYQENGVTITFKYNTVLNCVNYIRVRTNCASASNYTLTISYNKFKGDPESYIYKNDYSGENNPNLAVFQYNLFESSDGTILSTLDSTKFMNYKSSSDLYASEAEYEAGVAAAKAS